MIQMTKDSHVHTIFFVGHDQGDVLYILWKPDRSELQWTITTRIRTNGDGDFDPFSPNNNDRKSALEAKNCGVDAITVCNRLRGTVQDTSAIFPNAEVYEVLVDGDAEATVAALQKQPWGFMQVRQ